jgi:hypothetical protein
LQFINKPSELGPFEPNWMDLSSWGLRGPNTGPHALLASKRSNMAYLHGENRLFELHRVLQTFDGQAETIALLQDRIHEGLVELEREKERHWSHQREGFRGSTPIYNTGEH